MTLDKHELQGIGRINQRTTPRSEFEALLADQGYYRTGSAPANGGRLKVWYSHNVGKSLMTTDARLSTLEAQLQQLTINVTTLASITTQQSFEWNQRFNHLAELVASNSKEIEGLNERMDRVEQRIEQLDQKLEERTDTLIEAINRGIERAIAQTVEPLQNQITGLQTEMQRVIEILGEMR